MGGNIVQYMGGSDSVGRERGCGSQISGKVLGSRKAVQSLTFFACNDGAF